MSDSRLSPRLTAQRLRLLAQRFQDLKFQSLRNFETWETLELCPYITIAKFSSSCWRTGIAQPAISTRPAASSAAVGDTP